MEERARLKALEALFDPTTTARIVALPAGRGRDRSRGVAGQPVRPDDDLGKLWLPPPLVRQYGHRRSRPRDRSGQRSERRRRAGSQQNESRGAGTRRRLNFPKMSPTRTCVIYRSDDNG